MKIDLKLLRLPVMSTMIGVIVLCGILIVDQMMLQRHFPEHPMQIVIDRNTPLLSTHFKGEVIGQVHEGDTVSFLGVLEGGGARPAGLLVEKRSGERGIVSALDLGYPMRIRNDKDSMGVVTVLSVDKKLSESNILRCRVRGENGREKEINQQQLRPVLPDSMRHLVLRLKGCYLMSKEKFERQYIGQTMAENDARYRPALYVKKTQTGWQAFYQQLEVIDFDSTFNKMKPLVDYNEQGIATGYTLTNPHNVDIFHRYIYKYVPFVGKLMDFGPLASLIEGSIYQSWVDGIDHYGEGSDSYGVWRWTVGIGYILCALIWIFLLGTLPLLLLESALYCRYIFYPLSDNMLKILIVVVAIVSAYVWFVMASVWGCIGLTLPIILVACNSAHYRAERLLNTAPPRRCPKCRRMDLYVFTHREFIKEYDEWREESEAQSSSTKRWNSWTEIVTKWSDGRTTTDRRDLRSHKTTTTHYTDYKVLYHVKEYNEFYECQGCHNVEMYMVPEEKELKRIKIGEHTETTET